MPFRPNNQPVSASYRAALELLAGGGALLALRVFPRPYRFRRENAEGKLLGGEVPARTMAELCADDYVAGEALDPRRDAVRYRITPAGRQGWLHDAPPIDPAQLPLLNLGAVDDRPRTSMDSAA